MYNIIVNPIAGKGLASTNIKKVSKCLKKLKLPYLVYFSEKEKDIDDFAQNLYKAGEKDFIIVGGDGTINRFVNAIPEINKVNIGIIPSGTNNNFAKSINLPSNPVDALQMVIENKTQNFDVLKVNNMLACNGVSFGFIEKVKHEISRAGKKNNPNLLDYFKHLKKFEPFSVSYKGKSLNETDINAIEFFVANGLFFGKLSASPLSNLQDGLANIICLTQKEKSGKFSELRKLKFGKHIYNEENKMHWTDEISVNCKETPFKVNLDGELKEFDTLNVKVMENLLNIYYHD